MAKISDLYSSFTNEWHGLHFDTKNIFYAYLIIEIITEKLQILLFQFYNFDDITAANHKPITL